MQSRYNKSITNKVYSSSKEIMIVFGIWHLLLQKLPVRKTRVYVQSYFIVLSQTGGVAGVGVYIKGGNSTF